MPNDTLLDVLGRMDPEGKLSAEGRICALELLNKTNEFLARASRISNPKEVWKFLNKGEIEVEAGRALDKLVAEKIMGEKGSRWCEQCDQPAPTLCGCRSGSWGPYPYSTKLEWAWLVWEKIWNDGNHCCMTLRTPVAEDPEVEFIPMMSEHEKGKYVVMGKTVPHAICLAALKCVTDTDSPAKN